MNIESTPDQLLISKALANVPVLPELAFESTSLYEEASTEEVLFPLIEQNAVIMVAGAHFGDEGKGKTVDAIAQHSQIKLIVRVNSGENAGHTVFHGSKKFVFNLCPSGILLDKANMIGPECVMDPITFFNNEVAQLIAADIDYMDRLFVGNVLLVTPYHKLLDFLGSMANSSTLKGMAPSHASKVTKRGIRLDHIFNSEEVQRARLKKDMETLDGMLAWRGLSKEEVYEQALAMNADGNIRMPPHVLEFIKAEDRVQYVIDLYRTHVVNNPKFPKRRDVAHEIRTTVKTGSKVLIEGPQSYWLSNGSEKFWESSTSALTAASGLLAAAGVNLQKYKSVVINIHKTPGTSRVGNGACPGSYVAQDFYASRNLMTLNQLPPAACNDFDTVSKLFHASIRPNGTLEAGTYSDASGQYTLAAAMAISTALAHGEYGATTKRPRVTGMFDCVLHHEVNEVQGPYLSISAVDRGDIYDQVGVVIAYYYHHPEGKELDSNGQIFKNGHVVKAGDPLPTESVLFHCHPIIKLIPGWKDSPISAKTRAVGAPLPDGVMKLIGTIEHFTGAQVISIGNGPAADNLIYLKPK